ncbi:hypothetical protein QE400_002730 [Xanthomonas sacchari]|uniref:hypothetical protein n=1 Tax=Xanthomonas sacchari TaxID=56458 RepID=UPI0027844CF4|nr:hypothetical protein [Xanthomonas sacchari]MDQ1093317.1 hypothetical protein [Xanthomonas sacchari]
MHAILRHEERIHRATGRRRRRLRVEMGHADTLAAVATAVLSNDLPAAPPSSRHVTAVAASADLSRLPE